MTIFTCGVGSSERRRSAVGDLDIAAVIVIVVAVVVTAAVIAASRL